IGEYYQPGFSPKQHKAHLQSLRYFLQGSAYADPSIFYKNQAQQDGSFKAICELYAAEGITNLVPAVETHDLLGVERILAHWLPMEHGGQPTLKILCPRRLQNLQRPFF